MINFEYYMPTKIIFGKDTPAEVGQHVKEYGGHKCLVHYGGTYLKETGLLDKIEKSLTDSGIEYVEYDGVIPNPRLSTVYHGKELCEQNGVDFILAIGGGSAIDSSKAIAAACAFDGDIWDAFLGKEKITKALPMGVILTIPASGSESSKACVITKEEGLQKRMAVSFAMLPKFAILDPSTTYTLPAYQTAAGCCDIMSHLMERYFTQTPNVEFSDRMLEAGMITILNNAPRVLKDPCDYDARAEIMWTGNIAHNDLLNKGRVDDWASHNIEHELSALYDITHGAGLSIVTPAWMRHVYKSNKKRFVQFAQNVMGVNLPAEHEDEICLKGIEVLENTWKSWGMPIHLSDAGITENRYEEMALRALDGNETTGNFVKLTKEDIIAIFELAK